MSMKLYFLQVYVFADAVCCSVFELYFVVSAVSFDMDLLLISNFLRR